MIGDGGKEEELYRMPLCLIATVSAPCVCLAFIWSRGRENGRHQTPPRDRRQARAHPHVAGTPREMQGHDSRQHIITSMPCSYTFVQPRRMR